MNIRARVLENRITTALGAIAGACSVIVPLVISGSISRDNLLLALGLAALGGLLKDPGAGPDEKGGGDGVA